MTKTPPDDDQNKDLKNDLKVEQAKEFINKYRQSQHLQNVDPQVILQLGALKKIISGHKSQNPEHNFKKIAEQLTEQTTHETLRQERWRGKVRCPYCRSLNIKRLNLAPEEDQNNFKYECLACHETFFDDTETEMEGGSPPLHTWMFCWYLLGCTDSLQYIAVKLGLSVSMVEFMIQHMQKLFKAQQPLKHFLSFEEWSLKHGKAYKSIIQEALAKQQLLFTGETTMKPTDTAEYRRQKTRARDPGRKPGGPKFTP